MTATLTTIKASVDEMVASALAAGYTTITEPNEYRQHCLREHPNVCRQSLRNTSTYVLHSTPCGCAASAIPLLPEVPTKVCCWIAQPVAAVECCMCGEPFC